MKGSKKGKDSAVRVTREEVEAAFKFFDVNKTGELRGKDIKARIHQFHQMKDSDYQALIPEHNFTVEALWNLLESSSLASFDPVEQAFNMYDPNGTGYLDLDVLKQMVGMMGYGELSRDDIDTLIRAADNDGDGKISLEDFRLLLRNRNQQ
jgi:Ca2+-binding EF-hand superfamily protein